MWRSKKANHDCLIKTALIAHLSEAVREVQRNHLNSVVIDSEASQTLCSVIEALFAHKLKDSLIDRVANALNDISKQPSPNFWSVLNNFSHRHTIEYLVDSCPWLRTDIGRCRGWVRLVLNDGMLSSYWEVLTGEKKLLKESYEQEAFLRDGESVDIAMKLLRGIEPMQFRLAVNSSILNTWNTTALLLAGLWIPPTHVPHEAVVQGVDAALCFNDDDDSVAKKQPTLEPPKLDADLAFRLIIDSSSIPRSMYQDDAIAASLTPFASLSSSYDKPENFETFSNETPASHEISNQSTFEVTEPRESTAGDSVSATFTEAEEKKGFDRLTSCEEEEKERKNSQTFEDLLVNYSVSSIGSMKAPEVGFFSDAKPNDERYIAPRSSVDSFEVVIEPDKPSPVLTSMLRTLNHERGLVKQNYRCFDCSRPVGLIYGPFKICGFTGGYYCSDCHSDDEELIPARVFLNGDFSKRKISKSSRKFLNDINFDAILNSTDFDSNIHLDHPAFAALSSVRTQLHHLSAFLLTCRAAGIADSFRSRFCGKDYLYETPHLYSLADLAMVQSNQLFQHLNKIVVFGKHHVMSCSICVLKGFICESCRSDAVIFPFDVDSTYRCRDCGSVFHSTCMNNLKPCPRCVRWKSKSSRGADNEV